MLTAFGLAALCSLLQFSVSTSSESSEESFCSQTPETRRICQEMERFFKHGWKEDMDQSFHCRRCMRAGLHEAGSPHLRAFMNKTRSIACEVNGHCNRHGINHHKWKHQLVGDKPCTHGPAYWCSSLGNTEKCGTHEYCGKIWATQSLKSDYHDKDCMSCQRALAYLNFYGDQMRSDGIPKGHNVDSLRNLTQLGVSPSVLCYYMGRCKGKPVERQLDGKECVWAHSVWLRTRELYARNFRDFHYIMETLLDECLGDALCQRTVYHTLPVFVSKYGEYLADETVHTGETPCVEMKLCRPNIANKIYCDICLTFMTSAKRALQHEGSIEFVRKLMKSVCPLLASKRKECEDYIDQHIEKWVDDVDQNVDPVKICGDLKLCAKNMSDDTTTTEPVDSNACEQCENFVTRMRMRAICPVKKFFNFFLAQFCRFFGPLENQCVVQVDSLKDSIISLINAFMKTSAICSPFCDQNCSSENVPSRFSNDWVWDQAAKGICKLDESCQKRTAELLKSVFAWLDREESFDEKSFCTESKETMCQVCKSINASGLVASFTLNPKEIKLRVRQICSEQPSSLREACDLFVERYEPYIFRLLPELSKTGKHSQFCDRLNVCGNNDNCMVCALMSKELQKYLPSDVTEDAVKAALRKVCDNVGAYGEGCQRFVNDFEEAIIALMVKKQQTPRMLCRSLGVCRLNQNAVSMSTCEVCRFTVEAVERAVTTNATEEQIMEWASRACDKLPGSYKEKCREMIRTNLPTILQFLDSLIDPNLVCMKLGLCGPNAQHCQLSENVHALSSYCPLCEIAVDTLEPFVQNSPLATVLRVYLEEACINQLPKEYHQDCRRDAFKHLCKIVKVCPLSGQAAG